jgi:hypothetical protein
MNCKPNDLAIIIQSEHPDNIGRIVHIDEAYDHALDGAFRWAVSTVGAPLVGYDGLTDRIVTTRVGCIEDYMLRPISGVPIDDEITEDLKVPA